MSNFIAEITEIESIQTLHRVQLLCKEHTLSMISLELTPHIQVGTKVQLYVKSTNIIISREKNSDISIANQLKTTILSINYGSVLTTLKLDFSGIILESMITTKQAKKLNLQERGIVYAFINESDLSLSLVE
ncbi:TOBE domain-containing protein [Sulfurimonas sp. C5]|uniref:TOBE domain-containing protein n=1 Tax=Sulfurimonas sp. C5 TaxID=3036947 RepID=UPI0024582632|nr:TOBE domain-containing protein [Sulfurimonas sp. C5]MDH4944397.1 TOBE domain-containing protein [Sulfurimonas sp. C5]